MITKRQRRGDVTKPGLIHEYNLAMNGCDRADQNVGYYGVFNRKSYKWWKKIFYWIIEVTQHNAHILQVLATGKSSSFVEFKRELITQLIDLSAQYLTPEEAAKPIKHSSGRKMSTAIERFTSNKHLIAHASKDRDCVVCSAPKNRKRTVYYCVGCSDQPFLHPKECFQKYHTL